MAITFPPVYLDSLMRIPRPPVVEGAVVGYTPGMSPAHAPALGLVVLLDVVCLLTLLVTQSSSVQT